MRTSVFFTFIFLISHQGLQAQYKNPAIQRLAKPPPQAKEPEKVEAPKAPEETVKIEEAVGDKSSEQFRFLCFELSGASGRQKSGGAATSALIGWAPRLLLNDIIEFKLSLDAGYFKRQSVTSNIIIANAQVLSTIFMTSFFTEVGGGYSYWSGKSGYMQASANFGYEFSSPVILGLDRIFAGYSQVFNPADATSFFRLGVAFNML